MTRAQTAIENYITARSTYHVYRSMLDPQFCHSAGVPTQVRRGSFLNDLFHRTQEARKAMIEPLRGHAPWPDYGNKLSLLVSWREHFLNEIEFVAGGGESTLYPERLHVGNQLNLSVNTMERWRAAPLRTERKSVTMYVDG